MGLLDGKVVFITGATSGIGAAAMRRFGEEGAIVSGCGRSADAGQAVAADVEKAGGKAAFFQADVSKTGEIAAAVSSTVETYGALHCAVNNAGIEGSFGPLHELDEDVWDEVMTINMKGIWLAMKFEIPELLKAGGGSIVNVSTDLTRIGVPGTAIYTASKAGVDSLTKVAAMECGPSKIRVNAVNPGNVMTPMTDRLWTDADVASFEQMNPLKKIATADDVANTCLFLCSSWAGHINGELINIDGGLTLL